MPCQWVVFRAVLDFRSFCTACFVRITPPLRGSRQDEGASPKSRRWGEHPKRLLHPTAQGNRKGRIPPTAAACAWRLGCCDSPSRGE
ncbi:MAG: hypothetical protein OXU61_08320 [Gammaproteobacteria bacterium]|nr:hypothetical protein [Gammaproteobacteria bacterium]